MRILPSVALLLALTTAAYAQFPSGQGQLPGTLPPAPAVVPPPPPSIPSQVPSAVTPIPSPSYGVPPGVTRPVVGGSTPTVRYRYDPKPPKKRRFRPMRPFPASHHTSLPTVHA